MDMNDDNLVQPPGPNDPLEGGSSWFDEEDLRHSDDDTVAAQAEHIGYYHKKELTWWQRVFIGRMVYRINRSDRKGKCVQFNFKERQRIEHLFDDIHE